ncbi:hypothetical protein A9404_12280 [Halothiobacillus diazotrophicus]|uniref:Peptidase C39 domain-containing protein n=1 Tax=Halothiobacillus diazotrophicus TaxID=1860122 RepID=A0A191ZKU1_9GAMM|nr:hypothetical protein [Halothiobacillus diazotrophicus]ANJ68480.1 hypothetical protein A9404_12280 [Halothiobacillus diazotrophicus]
MKQPRQPVIQEEVTGCGIAAVAVIAGTTYAEARLVAHGLGIHADDSTLWSSTASVRRLLAAFGYVADDEPTPFAGWAQLPDLALLSLKWHLEKGKPYWHWVVFIRSGVAAYVLDSKKALKTHVRTDFGRMRPKWSLGVRTGST